MKVWITFLLLAVLLFPRIGLADAFDDLFSGDADETEPTVSGEFGLLLYESFYADIVHDREPEDPFDNVIRVLPHVRVQGDKWRAHVSLLASQWFTLGAGLRAEARVEAWEMFGEWNAVDWEISAGNMITRWGRGALSLLDLPNPLDLSHGLSIEDELSRRPIPQVKFSWFGDGHEVHAVYNPFYRGNQLANLRSDWSLVRLSETEDLEALPVFQQTVEQQVFPGTESLPPDDFLHGEVGVWWRYSIPGWDWGAYLFTGWDKTALPHFSEDFLNYMRQTGQSAEEVLDGLQVQEIVFFNPLYDQRPERNWYMAGDASTTWLGYTWRMEFLAQSTMSIYREDLVLLRPPAVSALIGMDSFGSEKFVFSLNLFVQGILTTEPLFQADPINIGAVAAVHWEPGAWPVALELRGGGLFNDGSFWASPMLIWSVMDNHQLSVGAEVIEGPEKHLAGGFSHNDSWIVRYRYQFLR